MKILNTQFTQWWNSLAAYDKDNTAIELARSCNVALNTVKSWGLGYRVPKSRSQDKIVSYFLSKGIQTDIKTLFPHGPV